MDSPADLDSYARGWRQRARAQAEQRRARAADLRGRVDQMARRLIEEFGARRVILFGSLSRGELRDDSDIDLAAEGLGNRWFDAWSAIEDMVPGRRVDLVPLEHASEAVRREALDRGEEIARA